MAPLLAGAFGLFRNSTSHVYVPTDPEEAAKSSIFASQLLELLTASNRRF
jgi:hypothetical protein